MPARPLSVWLCEILCAAAALWTLCAHATVASGGGLDRLLVAFAAVATLVVGVALALGRRASHEVAAPPAASEPAADLHVWARPIAVSIACAGLAAWRVTDEVLWLWWSGVLSLGIGVATTLRHRHRFETAAAGRGLELILWGLSLACVVFAWAFHHYDLDTPFYVSIATAAADTPAAPLMRDTLHGVAGLGLHMPAHRVHSFELLSGAISRLTGWAPLFCYQAVTVPVSAAFVSLAFAVLFRELTPRHWLACTVVVVLVLIAAAGPPRAYAQFAFVRLFHGKAVFLSVFAPLVYAYGLRFGRDPTPRNAWPLAAAQIAAVGCTSSAIWAAPIAAVLAVGSSVAWDRRVFATLAGAALVSLYPVGVGVTLLGDLGHVAGRVDVQARAGEWLADALKATVGDGGLAVASMAATLLAWTLHRPGPARRFSVCVPFAVFCLLLNPYSVEAVARRITGPSYWRALWALPVPVLLTLTLCAPLQLRGRPFARPLGVALASAATLWFVWFVPPFWSNSPHNGVTAGGFPKIFAPPFYDVVEELSRRAPPGSLVVAPQRIAIWVPTLPGHPFVSYAREVYLERLAAERGREAAQLRMLLSDVVSLAIEDTEIRIRRSDGFARRTGADPLPVFRRGLDDLDVGAVCLNRGSPNAAAVREILVSLGFVHEVAIREFEIWTRR